MTAQRQLHDLVATSKSTLSDFPTLGKSTRSVSSVISSGASGSFMVKASPLSFNGDRQVA
jgi:hypothetical protein